MLCNFGTPKFCIQARNTSFSSFYVRRLAKWSKPLPNIQSRMEAPQLRYLEIGHSGPKQKYCIFLCAEGLRNASKHSNTSFWVKCSRMDALKLWYPEILHSGPKHKFCIFLHAEG
jgi:hypothetical protein